MRISKSDSVAHSIEFMPYAALHARLRWLARSTLEDQNAGSSMQISHPRRPRLLPLSEPSLPSPRFPISK